jgi:hypothetical protein
MEGVQGMQSRVATDTQCLPACLHPLSAPPPLPAHQLVFTEVALGAVVLTVNVILLGGNIVFFQSLCLIGYCLFPIVLAAIICTLVKISVRKGGGRCSKGVG